eukprot:g13659.t1
MEAERSNNGGDSGIPRLRSAQASGNATETSTATVTAAAGAPPSGSNESHRRHHHHQQQQHQRQRSERPTRRELRWALPGEANDANTESNTNTLNNADGPRRSSLRRAISSSPTPSISISSSQQRQPRNGLRRRHSTRPRGGVDSSRSPEMFAGGTTTRRHTVSLGPADRFSRCRQSGAMAAAGERGAGASWQRGRWRRLRLPGRLCAAGVARHAAQHAVENLMSSSHTRNGALFLAGAFAASCGRTALLLTLWCIVVVTGAALWARSAPARSTLLPLTAAGAEPFPGPGGRAQLWVAVGATGERVGRGGGERFAETFSAAGWPSSVLTVALLPSALDAAALYCFFRLAARTESAWLALGLTVASAAFACSVGALVVLNGAEKLQGGGVKARLRRLMWSWHALLLVAAAAPLSGQQWDRAVARQGLGSILLALAAWQLGSVSAGRVERAVRYGVAVTLDRALSGAVDYELSASSLLELAFTRWLVDYWSQPPTFSAPQLREMLAQAVYSMTRDGLLAGVDEDGDHAPGAGGSPVSRDGEGAPASPPPPPALVASLTGWLEGKRSESPVTTRFESAPDAPYSFPPQDSKSPSPLPEALLLLRACPTLCASALLLCRALTGVPRSTWTEWAFLVALVVPAAVEAWRLRLLRGKLLRREGEESSATKPSPSPARAGIVTVTVIADGLSLFLQETNPVLSNVLRNALRAAEKLREDPSAPEGQANDASSRGSPDDAASGMPEQPLPPFHDKDTAFFSRQDLAARIRADRVLLPRPRLLKDYLAYSRPRSADSPAYPKLGRFTGSRINNSLGRSISSTPSKGALPSASATVPAAVAPAASPAPAGVASGVGVGVDATIGDAAVQRQARASSTPDLLAEAAARGLGSRGGEASTAEPEQPAADNAATATTAAADAAAAAAAPDVPADNPDRSATVNSTAAEDTDEQSATQIPTALAPAGVPAAVDAEGKTNADDWDLFGTGWAGVVVGAAGEVAGALGDVAGGAIGSVPVLGGVLEWWGGGGGGRAAQQERPEGGEKGETAVNIEKEGRGEDGEALVVDACGGGGVGGGVELRDPEDGGVGETGESVKQGQGGSVAEEEVSPVVDGSTNVSRSSLAAPEPAMGAQSAVPPHMERDGGDDGGGRCDNRQVACNKQEPTESPSSLYTITGTSSDDVMAGKSPVDDFTRKQQEQQQEQEQEQETGSVGASAEVSLSARQADGGVGEVVDDKIPSVSTRLLEEHKATMGPSQATESKAKDEGLEDSGPESERKSPEEGGGQLNLTGLAWWTVSRAAEFAGGAAYIFLPGFQDGKSGDRGDSKEGEVGGNAAVDASRGGEGSVKVGDVGDRSKACGK